MTNENASRTRQNLRIVGVVLGIAGAACLAFAVISFLTLITSDSDPFEDEATGSPLLYMALFIAGAFLLVGANWALAGGFGGAVAKYAA